MPPYPSGPSAPSGCCLAASPRGRRRAIAARSPSPCHPVRLTRGATSATLGRRRQPRWRQRARHPGRRYFGRGSRPPAPAPEWPPIRAGTVSGCDLSYRSARRAIRQGRELQFLASPDRRRAGERSAVRSSPVPPHMMRSARGDDASARTAPGPARHRSALSSSRAPPHNASANSSFSRCTAWCRRDFTVPIGMSRTSATSRYFSPS